MNAARIPFETVKVSVNVNDLGYFREKTPVSAQLQLSKSLLHLRDAQEIFC